MLPFARPDPPVAVVGGIKVAVDWSSVWSAVQYIEEFLSVDWTSIGAVAQGIGQLGIAGAVIAAVIRVWWEMKQARERSARQATEEEARRRRELEGLLRMLLVEIEENERQFQAFKERPILITKAPPSYLRWGIWEDVRTRVAQLLEDEAVLSDIARCYDMIQQIAAFRLLPEDVIEEQNLIQEINSQLPKAKERCETAADHIRRYVPEATGANLPRSE